MNEPNLYVAGLLTLVGVVSHILKKIVEVRQEDDQFHLITYLTKYPYQTMLIFLGAIGGFFVLLEVNQLTYASAFGMGYIANSMGDVAGKRTKTVIG